MDGCHLHMTATWTGLNLFHQRRIVISFQSKFGVKMNQNSVAGVPNGTKEMEGIVQCPLIVNTNKVKYASTTIFRRIVRMGVATRCRNFGGFVGRMANARMVAGKVPSDSS
jgi:hypothetical protein